jgi:hypothetical protein
MRAGMNVFDSLEIYQWKPSDTSYIAVPIYLPGFEMFLPDTTTVKGGEGNGYTIFNISKEAKSLEIAPVPYTSLKTSKLAKKSDSQGTKNDNWGLQLRSKMLSGEEVATSYFYQSSNEKSRFYQSSPTFRKIRMHIYDRTSGKLFGHMVSGVSGVRDTTLSVLFVNNSDKKDSCLFFVGNTIGFNDNKRLRFSGSNNVYHSINDSLVIPLEPNQTSMVTLYVGDVLSSSSVDAFSAQKLGVYSIMGGGINGALRFNLGIPATADLVKFQIFTIAGKMIINKELGPPNKSGLTEIQFNEAFPKGMYVVRLLINDSNKQNMISTKPFLIAK